MVVCYIGMSSTTHLSRILKLGFTEQIPYSRTTVELPSLQLGMWSSITSQT